VIGILGGISYLADKHEYLRLRDLLKDDFNTIVIYYGTGVMVFFVLHGSVELMIIFFAVDDNGRNGCRYPLLWLPFGMIFCLHVITGGLLGVYFALEGAPALIQWILNRHNSILAMKEHTKEYVVEDLHGNIGNWIDGIWVWNWDCIKSPRGRVVGELKELEEMMAGISIDRNRKDTWKWKLDPKGEFLVKYVSELIEQRRVRREAGCTKT
nr:zinc finger, RING-CH-type [Tanacetum cinerariifolium]